MRIIYNGIDLQVLDVHEAVCQPVYDDSQTDLLYCAYRFSVTAMVNGLAAVTQNETGTEISGGPGLSLAVEDNNSTQWTVQSSYFPPKSGMPAGAVPTDKNVGSLGKTYLGNTDNSQFSPAIISGNRPTIMVKPASGPTAVTMQILNSKLNEPRAMLWVFDDNGGTDDVIVQSYKVGQMCDCKNGPLPIATNIIRSFGDGATYFVNFQVQTFVDLRMYPANQTENILISNRFSTTHVVNEDSMLSIAVTGVATGRTDIMYDNSNGPNSNLDILRKSLFLPVPGGFIRTNIQVTGSPDGTQVRYSYVDQQQPVNFVAGRYCHATQIEAVHRQAIQKGDLELGKLAVDAYERVNTLRLNNAWRKQIEADAKDAASHKGDMEAKRKADLSSAKNKAAYWKKKAKSVGKSKPSP